MIDEVYLAKVRRCTATENVRLERERVRKQERRDREKLRGKPALQSNEGIN